MTRVFVTAVLLVQALATAPQSERACHPPEQQRMAFYPGVWQVTLETRLAQPGVWATTDGTADVTIELSGCLFVERLRTTRDGKPQETVSLVRWDPARGRWQLTWKDSGDGGQLTYEGRATNDGIDFRTTQTLDRRTITLRRLFALDGPRSLAWEAARSNDGGATWDVTGRASYTKR